VLIRHRPGIRQLVAECGSQRSSLGGIEMSRTDAAFTIPQADNEDGRRTMPGQPEAAPALVAKEKRSPRESMKSRE
jgi:hypothetical protein